MKANMKWDCLSRSHKFLAGVCSYPLRTSFGFCASKSGEDPNIIRQWYEGGPYEIVLIFDIIESKKLKRRTASTHFLARHGPVSVWLSERFKYALSCLYLCLIYGVVQS
jgi:hypothetical protein